EADGPQLDVLHDVGESLATEPDHAWEHDLGPDADLVEQLDARTRVVRGDVGLLDLPLVEALERPALVALPVDDAPRAGPAEHRAVDDPRRRAVDLRHVRHAVAPLARRAAGPQV